MTTSLRRSPRFQQQSQNTQPTVQALPSFNSFCSATSSTISTSHPSPTNDTLNLANQSQQYPLQLQSQFLASAQGSNAPLPSPSANEINPFAGRPIYQYNNQIMSGQSQEAQTNTNAYQSIGNPNQNSQPQQSQQYHHNSFSQAQRQNNPPTSVNGVPPGLPADFLAEAAKRAQMACLMRDLDDVSL